MKTASSLNQLRLLCILLSTLVSFLTTAVKRTFENGLKRAIFLLKTLKGFFFIYEKKLFQSNSNFKNKPAGKEINFWLNHRKMKHIDKLFKIHFVSAPLCILYLGQKEFRVVLSYLQISRLSKL